MGITPMKSFVLAAELKRENTTDSGIVIQSAAGLGDSKTAKVVAIGPDVKDLQVGDVVLLDWTKCQIVSVDGAQRVMIKEEFIVAVIEQ